MIMQQTIIILYIFLLSRELANLSKAAFYCIQIRALKCSFDEFTFCEMSLHLYVFNLNYE